jgi:hypothetical protein
VIRNTEAEKIGEHRSAERLIRPSNATYAFGYRT